MAQGTEQPPMDRDSGGDHVPPTQNQESSPTGYDEAERGQFGRVLNTIANKIRRHKRGAIALAATAAVAVAYAGGRAAAGGEGESAERPGPIATHSATLEPTPTPTPTVSETPTISPEPSESKTKEKDDTAVLQGYLERDHDDFNKLSRQQRSDALAYAYWDMHVNLTYNEGLQLVVVPEQPGKPALHMYDFNPWDVNHGAHKNNTGPEIVRIAAFGENAPLIAYASPSDPTGKRDLQKSLNLIPSYYSPQDEHPELTSTTYNKTASLVRKYNETFTLNADEIPIAINTGPLTKGEDLEGNPIEYRDILQSKNGKASLVRYILDTATINVPSADGKSIETATMHNWIPFSSMPKNLNAPN